MAFHPDDIMPWLPDSGGQCHVAYSGGMDSHVLLHAMARLRDAGKFTGALMAIHVNHRLNPQADEWAEHCRRVCQALAVELQVYEVDIAKGRLGPEQAAREARYQVFTDTLKDSPGTILTAHHQDDQVETQLYRMMRGTGIRGLAGIRPQRPLGAGQLVRPLLGATRSALQAYAERKGLFWIEDDSNSDESLDRNYLRHQVVPVLGRRWPAYRTNLARLAGLAQEGQALLLEIGAEDLAGIEDGPCQLAIAPLLALSPARRRNAVRCWLVGLESALQLPPANQNVMARVFDELLPAAEDAEPVIHWQQDDRKASLRRFAGHIHLVLPAQEALPAGPVMWHTAAPLHLPGAGTVSLEETASDGFLLPANGMLEIRFRQGGESAKPAGRKTRPLKKILQDYQVPPWLRDSIPLFYRDDELLAVGDLFVTEHWRVRDRDAKGKKIHRIHWLRSDLHCGS